MQPMNSCDRERGLEESLEESRCRVLSGTLAPAVWQQSYPPNSVGSSVIAFTVVSTWSPNSSGTSAALR